MSRNVRKCGYASTARISSNMVYLDPDNAVAPWVTLVATGDVPYLGLKLAPTGIGSINPKHVLRSEAVLGWCRNMPGPASTPHEVMAAVVGGIVRYAAPFLLDSTAEIVRFNGAIKIAALQLENLPKDLSNIYIYIYSGIDIVVRPDEGLGLADV